MKVRSRLHVSNGVMVCCYVFVCLCYAVLQYMPLLCCAVAVLMLCFMSSVDAFSYMPLCSMHMRYTERTFVHFLIGTTGTLDSP